MRKWLLLALFVVICPDEIVRAEDSTSKGDRVGAGYLKAEARGLLIWRDSRYRVIVQPQERPVKELVLDLWISEDKGLVRRLEDLRGKQVIVSGNVVWVPKGSQVNSDADYTLGFAEFEIRQAPTK